MRKLLALLLTLFLLPASAYAACNFFAAGSAILGGSGNMANVGIPASIANNDILVVFVHTKDNVDSTMPGDWTPLVSGNGNTTNRIEIWWKRTTGSESAPTVTRAVGDSAIAVMHAYRGCESSGSPWDNVGTIQSNTGSPISTASITTSAAGDLILHAFGSQDNNTWNASTLTGIPTTMGSQHANSAGSDNSLGIAYGQQGSAGASGTAGATQQTLGPDAGASVQLALLSGATDGDVTLTGIAATATLGTLSVLVATDEAVSLTGLGATSGMGSLSVSTGTTGTVILTGLSATPGQGTLSASGGATIALTGLSATTGQGGLIVLASATVPLTGLGSTSTQGALSVSDGSVPAGQSVLQGGGLGDQNTPMGGMW